jgi:hypothetical protein
LFGLHLFGLHLFRELCTGGHPVIIFSRYS